MSRWVIRRAVREDCPGILAIYNDAVLHTTASYDEQPRTLEHREAWFDARARDGYAVFVAEEASQVTAGPPRVVGWSALNPYHERVGFRFTAETSVYIAADRRGQGLGALLVAPLLPAATERGLHTLIAAIDATNTASLRLHARFGFVQAGHFREVGFKFGRWLDVIYLQLHLPARAQPASG